MCGRYKGPDTWAELHAVLSGFTLPLPMTLPREIRPTNQVPMVIPDDDGYQVEMARWSLIPSWYRKELKEWNVATFNARLEAGTRPGQHAADLRRIRLLEMKEGLHE